MKNVAKCDTWCELQNPVNHRVFERKLRPTPLGRGHACLGVTHPSPPLLPPPAKGGARSRGGHWPPAELRLGGWPKIGPAATHATTSGGFERTPLPSRLRPEGEGGAAPGRARRLAPSAPPRKARDPRSRPQVRREHPLSLSISISGGKETYKDSPSNGERTGKSPA